MRIYKPILFISAQCATCQKSTTDTRVQFPRTNSNKRLRLVDQMYHEENDAMVPISPSTPKFQSTISVPVSEISSYLNKFVVDNNYRNRIHRIRVNRIVEISFVFQGIVF